jgi:hypothetical protein
MFNIVKSMHSIQNQQLQNHIHMKKSLLIIAAVLFVANASFAQNDKKVRFGITATPAINWMTPDNDKKVQKNGAVMKAGIGLALEFKLTDVVSFQTGLEYMGAGFKAKYTGSDSAYYLYKDDAIVKADIAKGDSLNGFSSFIATGGTNNRLVSRKYNMGYLNIPLAFKMKTKDIGGFTYFGQIGAAVMIRMKARGNDEVVAYDKTSYSAYPLVGKSQSIDKVDIAKTMNLFNLAAGVGGGAEYNISGSTSLYASIHYQHSFTSTTKADSDYLIRAKTDAGKATGTAIDQFQNTVRLRQIVLSVGVLF